MNRRDFLRTSAVFGSAALARHRFPYEAYASPSPKHATDLVTLGRTGIKVTRLAQGTGTNGVERSSNQIRGLGFQGVADLLRTGVDNGINFWDLADQYGSHPHARQALKAIDRDKVVIMTKTRASTEAEMRADLDRFRKEIGTDRIDLVLLHCMTEADWPRTKAGAMAVLSEAKEKGTIRAHGVSCHDFGALKTAAATRLGRRGPRSLQRGGCGDGRAAPAGVEGAREHEGEGQGHHRHEDPGRGTAPRPRGRGAPGSARDRDPRRLHHRCGEPDRVPRPAQEDPARQRPRVGFRHRLFPSRGLGATFLVSSHWQRPPGEPDPNLSPPPPNSRSPRLVSVAAFPGEVPLKPTRPALVRIVALIGLLPFAAASALAADLALTKVGPGGVKLGDQIQYTITVTNLDAGAVRDGVVQDATPAGLVFVSNAGACTTAFPCALPLLNALETATITSTFTVPATYAGTDPFLNTATVTSTADNNTANNTATAATAIARVEGFYTLPPCRVLDTRGVDGPALVSGFARTFNLRDLCGLPANAIAVSFNITVTGPNVAGNLRLYPGGTAAPLASSINFAPGQTRANNGIVPVSADGKLTIRDDQPGSYNLVHAILDVNGYFAKSETVATVPGQKVRVRPAPEVEITFDNVTGAGVTSAKVIEFPDNRTGNVDQDLKDFFPPARRCAPWCRACSSRRT